MINVDLLMQVAKYVEDATALGIHAFKLIREGKAQHVSDILPATLMTTMARQRAEMEAQAKFFGGNAP